LFAEECRSRSEKLKQNPLPKITKKLGGRRRKIA